VYRVQKRHVVEGFVGKDRREPGLQKRNEKVSMEKNESHHIVKWRTEGEEKNSQLKGGGEGRGARPFGLKERNTGRAKGSHIKNLFRQKEGDNSGGKTK